MRITDITELEKEEVLVILDLRRENVLDEDLECSLCGTTHLPFYWKTGAVTLFKRANIFCDNCHEAI